MRWCISDFDLIRRSEKGGIMVKLREMERECRSLEEGWGLKKEKKKREKGG